jgi:two-component system CheB/CheR fusion protein
MARLLDDLLEASRVTENKIELRKRVVDLRDVARDAADAVRSAFDAREIRFAVAVDDEAVRVEGDPARLQQIQVNLLNNAAKYTPPGGHVWLSVRREGDDAVIRVRDDGAGIAKEMLEMVFDLFVQANGTLDRAQGGIGVGLTLVRSLVEMHSGTVAAFSEGEGKGAELVVRLPLASRETDAPSRREPRGGLHLPQGARVAIIEDNADSREMLCEALTYAGFQCESADNGVAGLALVESMKPDVAIIDVGLPAIDGFELARRLRANPSLETTRLLALTGYGQREDRERALAAGFDEHLVKPVDPVRLARFLSGNAG